MNVCTAMHTRTGINDRHFFVCECMRVCVSECASMCVGWLGSLLELNTMNKHKYLLNTADWH